MGLKVGTGVLQIATFGSCLARRVAERYIDLFGGFLASSVYHNRSDFFVETWIDRTRPPLDHARLAARLGLMENGREFGQFNVLANQAEIGLGRHLLPSGMNFLECLSNRKIDLVILDNFMDVSAMLWETDDGVRFFSRGRFDLSHGCTRVPYLTPPQAAAGFERILAFIRARRPKARLIFLHFPFNRYVKNRRRIAWGSEFADVLRSDGAAIVPPLDVPERYWDESIHHYRDEMYYAYAGLIGGLHRIERTTGWARSWSRLTGWWRPAPG